LPIKNLQLESSSKDCAHKPGSKKGLLFYIVITSIGTDYDIDIREKQEPSHQRRRHAKKEFHSKFKLWHALDYTPSRAPTEVNTRSWLLDSFSKLWKPQGRSLRDR
jgi:hypothetical protein